MLDDPLEVGWEDEPEDELDLNDLDDGPKAKREYVWTVVCPRPLIVRIRSDRTSALVGELAPGSQVKVCDSIRMNNGEKRMQVIQLDADEPFGWVTQLNNRGIQNLQPGVHSEPAGSPERRKQRAAQRQKEKRDTTDREEVEELKSLLNNRDSSLQAGAYAHFQAQYENTVEAKKMREEHEARIARIAKDKEDRINQVRHVQGQR